MEKKIEETFIKFAAPFGSSYIENGGPTSRLEDGLTALGNRAGLEVEVFATPTGIFISSSKEGSTGVTVLQRIKGGTTHLGEVVRLEGLLDSLSGDEESLKAGKIEINQRIPELSSWSLFSAAFVAGASVSYSQFGWGITCLLSGIITAGIASLSGPISRFWQLSGILSDFLSSFLALSIGGLIAWWMKIPIEAIVIGPLVFLVPGLTLTNAVSELAEHNFVSGTAKTMKGVLILVAMGCAFFLTHDLSKLLGLGSPYTSSGSTTTLVEQFIGIPFLISAFGLIFKIPLKLLPFAVITGVSGWGLMITLAGMKFLILGTFLPALLVGLISLGFGRLFKTPSQIFSVPGIFSLLPGFLALSSFFSFSSGMQHKITEIGFQVLTIAASITFGLYVARIPYLAFEKRFGEPQ